MLTAKKVRRQVFHDGKMVTSRLEAWRRQALPEIPEHYELPRSAAGQPHYLPATHACQYNAWLGCVGQSWVALKELRWTNSGQEKNPIGNQARVQLVQLKILGLQIMVGAVELTHFDRYDW